MNFFSDFACRKTLSALKRPCQKSLPSSLFQREESFPGFDGEFLPLFPPLEKGDEGGFDGFSKG
jgi:hypothetical protein